MAHIGSGIGETKKKEAYDNSPEPNLSFLPNELLLRIIKFLPFSNLNIVILLKKRFNDLGSDPILWKRFPIQAMDIARTPAFIKTLKLYESYQTLDTSGKRIQGKIKRGEKLKLTKDMFKSIAKCSPAFFEANYESVTGGKVSLKTLLII